MAGVYPVIREEVRIEADVSRTAVISWPLSRSPIGIVDGRPVAPLEDFEVYLSAKANPNAVVALVVGAVCGLQSGR